MGVTTATIQLSVQYIPPGKANVIADTLSRPPHPDAVIKQQVDTAIIDLSAKGSKNIRDEQLTDPELKKVMEALNDQCMEEAQRWLSRGYFLFQGILHRYAPDSDTETAQLVIATQEQDIIQQ